MRQHVTTDKYGNRIDGPEPTKEQVTVRALGATSFHNADSYDTDANGWLYLYDGQRVVAVYRSWDSFYSSTA